MDLLCHPVSWGLCMAPALLVWLPTHRRIPGAEKAKIMLLYTAILINFNFFSDFPVHTFSLVMSRSPTEYLSHLINVLTVYKALWNCLSISVNSSKTLLADHSSTYMAKKMSNIFHLFLAKNRPDKWICGFFYLASPGLYIPHASCVGLESDHGSKVHIFSEEL